jgi:hypothetical protein
VSAFFRRAEEILEIASRPGASLGDTLVVLDRQGGIRMVDATGWSLSASAAEFGAEAVYRIERRGGSVRIEGWNGPERCLLQGQTGAACMRSLVDPGFAAQATILQLTSAVAG